MEILRSWNSESILKKRNNVWIFSLPYFVIWYKGVNTIIKIVQFSSVAQSCPTLRPHESQHARPPCPSPTPGVHSDSSPSSQWCHPAISSSVIPFSSCTQSLPASVFSNESALHMRWPKYWSFSLSISPSKEHPGLISFRMDWLDLLAIQGTLKSLLQSIMPPITLLSTWQGTAYLLSSNQWIIIHWRHI